MDWSSAFSTITAAAGSTATVAFIAKLFANTLATRTIKKFELVNVITLEEEKAKHQRDIEEVKLQLSKLQKEHEIVFSSLYLKRQEVIISLYKLMSNFVIIANSNTHSRTTQITEQLDELVNYFDNNRLYFPEDVAIEINNVMNIACKLSKKKYNNEYQQLLLELKIQVYDQMENIFRELLKTENYR